MSVAVNILTDSNSYLGIDVINRCRRVNPKSSRIQTDRYELYPIKGAKESFLVECIEENTIHNYVHEYESGYKNNLTINFRCLDAKKLDNLNKIDMISNLEYDWNGNNGLEFSDESIDFFKKIIGNIIVQPDLAPTGRQSLQIEYDLEDGSYLAFEIFLGKVTSVEIPKGNYDEALEEFSTRDCLEFINEKIRGFYGE